ncbi:putative zinc finger protein [Leptomonas pyrrhocoris]|uniref:Putative zinc finger protein n=1 Tax=Leptomonas pyrrhocoris TaxID=157538 RepID=A0A0N0DW36_LEPPY|nr:putative zinc finger protein [Leptomonas pyrrhocoris]XP_015659701.1 putative zinc finger protein [Leptomonas pyrrhocoris]KPA81261.1 putative zinc finger protein [Leptomonas pyrrhocoris]KPA81262.1 putative zinc finger protein [Leptomonas pyrrhocoris]|eukprot:XP_015659700.1 putative zinc finger protein [Leptomonas pyrrhocoris]
MHIAVPIFAVGPYSLAFVVGLLLYWNASLIISRCLTAFLATMIATRLDLAFHLLYACLHHVVASVFRLRVTWDLQDVLQHFQFHSQLYVIADVASISLLVGNTLQFWAAALITRIALSALASRTEIWMRWWESQSVVDHVLATVGCLVCVVGCALQWAYYVLLPQAEREEGGFASLLMWYTSTVYIVAVGVRAACNLTTALMRLCGYRLMQCLANKVDRVAARALEDSGLNPHSEVHQLYMAYLYAVVCAVTAWYYSPSSLPMWMQCFVLLRLYLIASASWKLQHYKQVLDRFPSVTADPSKACAICRDDFLPGEHVTCLPCGHTFHGACVRSWLVRAATCPTCRQPVADAAWRTGQPRRGAVRGVAVGRFTGSIQPLAPRLPAAAPHTRDTRNTPRTLPTTATAAGAAHSSSLPSSRLSSSTAHAFVVAHAPLPHLAELQRIEAERRALAQHRQDLLSQSSSPVTSPVAAPARSASEASIREVERGQVEENGVDPLLFTDTPLAPAESPAEERQSGDRFSAAPHRKRQRADAATAGGESATGEEASPRRRRE